MTWLVSAPVAFFLYFLFDVNYFIRSAFTIIHAKTKKKIGMRDPATIYGFVLTTDIDFLLTHMNNARFLRECDFARIDHGTRSGFFKETMSRGGMILLSSSFIRYRLPLPIFSRYKVVTEVIWWDEKNVYLTHKLITLKDDIIRAIVYARASCLKVNVFDIAEIISPGVQRPELETVAPDYRKWMETLELSSQLMKQAKLKSGGGDNNEASEFLVKDGCTSINEDNTGNSVHVSCETCIDRHSKVSTDHQD